MKLKLPNGSGWDWHKPVKEKRIGTKKAALLFIAMFAFLTATGAVTQIDLPTQVKNVLKVANGGTGTASTLTGLVRGSGSAMTAAELSGDATTSGSNVVTNPKINGTSVPTNSTADQVIVTTASATGSWASIPNCTTGALSYATATHTFSCATILTGTFADAETPSGTIDGSNAVFTLAHTPSPAGSLLLLKNGQEMVAGGADYTLATATATFVTGAKPQTGDVLVAYYRY